MLTVAGWTLSFTVTVRSSILVRRARAGSTGPFSFQGQGCTSAACAEPARPRMARTARAAEIGAGAFIVQGLPMAGTAGMVFSLVAWRGFVTRHFRREA